MSDDADIHALVEKGQTIAAIRVHQGRHGGTLVAARAAIEAIHFELTRRRGAGSLERELDDLVRRGDRIAAIKRYRDATGCGLKEAVDFLARREAPAPATAVNTAPPGAPDPVDEAIRAGQMIQAIKLLRERTGLGLKEARDAVEARKAALPPAAPPAPAAGGSDPEVDRLLRAGDKIGAIKRHRQITGLGLKECKDAVEARAAVLAR